MMYVYNRQLAARRSVLLARVCLLRNSIAYRVLFTSYRANEFIGYLDQFSLPLARV